MPTVSYPGVYVREIPSGVQAISGVATSIATFVGMAKAGPLNIPTTVLGIQDYERVFSDDTSQGEMTEQVRQFFLNGGEQAIICRVADGALPSSVGLTAAGGATVLTLQSRDAGLLANRLRARVSYNTASPERSFELEIFVEEFDASGQPEVTATETFSNLSMAPSASRYVRNILDQQSLLVTATIDDATTAAEEAAALAAATVNGFSASAEIFADTGAAEAALLAAVQATQAGNTGTAGRLQVRIEGENASPTVTVSVDVADTSLATLATTINTALAPHTPVTVTVPDPTDEPLIIRANAAQHDVVIEPAAQFDISAALGLGVTQGGIEVGAWSQARPVPSGLVSVLDDGSGDLAAILSLGGADRTTLTDLGVDGTAAVNPFTIATADIVYPGAGTTFAEGTQSTATSFRNIAENLQAVAIALSAESEDWRAEVHGLRLALIPEFGSASSGGGATFVSATPDLSLAGELFGGVTSTIAASALGGGTDGNVAQLEDYMDAFQQIEERVNIFNIMILPKSAGDTTVPGIRAGVWGPASAFCRDQLAVLLVDVEPAQQTTQGVLDSLQGLRTGVATDYAAAFWPRVSITSNGLTRPIDPSGSMAGVMARIDGSRGVWKASAGVEASLFGVRGVDVPLSDPQNGQLNPEAINCIRSFPNGVLAWGARTMAGFDASSETDYRYLPVRRIALFIEASLRNGLQFAVFEPNDAPLWSQIRLAAGSFMNGLFRQGAFAGNTATDAFFVKCDAETTTPTDQALGIVNVAVGFAPLRPAEFVVVTLQQRTAQAQV
ncbi:phage tail sheath family protein [Ruegeria jejuensis]|uniref:phage tail sheath family protein n=1 Tax=Ruegeria jejuensis TaxID=3233338 RepID=UPI00355C7112